MRPQRVITLAPSVQEFLLARMDADETRMPHYMPMLMPPKRWEGVWDGGYYTPMVRGRALISFKAEPEQARAALSEYESLDMPRVLAALHAVQETPWRINRKVLSVALRLWDQGLPLAGFPSQDAKPLPPKPPGVEQDEKLLKQWKREAAKVYGENATAVGKANSVRTTLWLATKFIAREFYFPHNLDFRGRMYPIPAQLNPQGNDLARGLLTFAKGLPLGERGVEWLAIHLANHFGADKMSYQGRIEWVRSNESVWRAIAEDPIRNRSLWLPETGMKHHWQGLAAVFEWVRYLDEGPGMVSSLPIHIDGTCNGIQHLSAMMRDEVGGVSVNLLPSAEPHDIYKDVAERLQAKLEGIADAGGAPGVNARMWLDACGKDGVPRSLTKRPVMTTPYGATREAHFKAVHEWLKEAHEDKGRSVFAPSAEESHQHKKVLVPWLVTHLTDSLDGILDRGKACMSWLQQAAKAVAECNQPIVWKTPSGFVVRHFYSATKQAPVSTMLDGKKINLSRYTETNKLSVRDQLRGIAPNFTHSMDASANMETIIFMANDPRLLPITAIHDAYGTCAGAMEVLYNAVRYAFVWVHQDDVLEDFRQSCISMYRDYLLATRSDLDFPAAWRIAEDTIPRVPERGTLDVSAVADSEYFFH